jgi:hypothetical protein
MHDPDFMNALNREAEVQSDLLLDELIFLFASKRHEMRGSNQELIDKTIVLAIAKAKAIFVTKEEYEQLNLNI